MANEQRLIDANALRQEIESKIYWVQVNNVAVLEAIDEAKAVDAVEVVRCKDCKHSEPCGESRQCLHPFGLNICDGNDFCSYGERRTDD